MKSAKELPVVTVDCAGVISTADFWQRYLDATQPEGGHLFGRNLDAFWDAVSGGGPGWPGEVELVFANSNALEHFTDRSGNRSFLQCLTDISERPLSNIAITMA